MSESGLDESDYSRVLGLIDRAARSSDPRLRGNAFDALTALSEAQDPGVATRARSRLVDALVVEDSPLADSYWRFVFRERTLDAMRQLPPVHRQEVLISALFRLRRLRDISHHKSIAGALLEAEASGLVHFKCPASIATLLMGAGGITALTVIWQSAWRIAISSLCMMLLVAAMSSSLGADASDSLIGIVMVFIFVFPLLFGVSARWSYIGRPFLPRRHYYIDASISGATMALYALLGVLFIGFSRTPPVSVGPLSVEFAIIFGFIVGFIIRLGRWPPFPGGSNPIAVERILRTLWALSIASIPSILAAMLGERAPAFGVWVILFPAAGALASLDYWLERRQSEYAVRSRTFRSWFLIIVPVVVTAILLVANNISNWKAGAYQPRLVASASLNLDKMALNEPQTIDVSHGEVIALIGDGSKYSIKATASNVSEDIGFRYGSYDLINKKDEAATNVESLSSVEIKGNFWICADIYGENRCPSPIQKNTDDLIYLSYLGKFLGGAWSAKDESPAARVTKVPPPESGAADATFTIVKLDS